MSGVIVPNDVTKYTFSFLNHEELGCAECVCKSWQQISVSDGYSLWKELFSRTFRTKRFEDESVKKSFKIELKRQPVETFLQLAEVINCFYCGVEWETKQKLSCTFSRQPSWSIVVEQGFGPTRGTKEGFEKDPPREARYYKYLGDVSADIREIREFFSSKMFLNETSNNAVEHYNSSEENFFKNKVFNFCCAPSYYRTFSADCTPIVHETVMTLLDRRENIPLEICLDMGRGNALGYYSSANNWAEPFKLTCIQDYSGVRLIKWIGLLPHGQFKFVKISGEGKTIIWEAREKSRDSSDYQNKSSAVDPIRFSS